MRWRQLWLCLPAVALMAADGGLTLVGQPSAYWSDGFTSINEGNPLAAELLATHPLLFAAAGIPYLAIVVGITVALPRWWAAVFAVAIASAHAVGVAAWCVVIFPQPQWPLLAMFAMTAGLAAVAWRRGWASSVDRSQGG
jgi:hypothetical protein